MGGGGAQTSGGGGGGKGFNHAEAGQKTLWGSFTW